MKQLQELKLEFDGLNQRVRFLELQNNNNQNNDDKKFLKTSLSYLEFKQTNEMIHMPNQVEIVEPKKTWQKRPARLFPLHILR